MKVKDFNQIKSYTYFIRRKCDGLKYHGVRWKNISLKLSPDDDFAKQYFSSGILRQEFKTNPTAFEFRLCWTFDTIEEARLYETEVNKKIYNRVDWANNNAYPAIYLNKESRKKISEKAKQRLSIPENNPMYGNGHKLPWAGKTRPDHSERMKGENNPFYKKHHTNESKQKISKTQTGKKYSEEVNKKKGLSGNKNPFYGKHHTEDSKRKMKESHQGATHSEDTKRKMSDKRRGEKNAFYGKRHTEETKQKSIETKMNNIIKKHNLSETETKYYKSLSVGNKRVMFLKNRKDTL